MATKRLILTVWHTKLFKTCIPIVQSWPRRPTYTSNATLCFTALWDQLQLFPLVPFLLKITFKTSYRFFITYMFKSLFKILNFLYFLIFMKTIFFKEKKPFWLTIFISLLFVVVIHTYEFLSFISIIFLLIHISLLGNNNWTNYDTLGYFVSIAGSLLAALSTSHRLSRC